MRLIFVHIPKTAGVAIAAALTPEFGPPSNPWDYLGVQYEHNGRSFLQNMDMLRALLRAKVPIISNQPDEFLMGHIPYQAFVGIFPEAKRITFLRQPVMRVISAYHHWRKHELIPLGMSLLQFAQRPDQQNVQYFFTAGGRLDGFDFVGCVENAAYDYKELCRQLGFTSRPLLPKNVGKYRRGTIFEDKNKPLYDALVSLNALDIELYERYQSQKETS